SSVVAERVAAARRLQKERYADFAGEIPGDTNAVASGKVLEAVAPLSGDAKNLLNQAVEKGRLSARAYFRILRVARTIGDLAGGAKVLGRAPIAEALSYRRILLN
ncbi:MAG: ATP-binding protein, partial [Alphaproteobacteria bacterium]|nr:ATP-binding protein [Alphaproteobacteria bacterium]